MAVQLFGSAPGTGKITFGTADPLSQYPKPSPYTGLAANINKYLATKGSPLAGLGNTFVTAGAQYGVDPRLLVAISGAESSFGKNLLGSYNAWGWGPGKNFPNFKTAINSVASGLSSGYIKQGRTTIPQIAAKWAPVGAGNDPNNLNANWVGNVSKYYTDLGGTTGTSTGGGGGGGGVLGAFKSGLTDVGNLVTNTFGINALANDVKLAANTAEHPIRTAGQIAGGYRNAYKMTVSAVESGSPTKIASALYHDFGLIPVVGGLATQAGNVYHVGNDMLAAGKAILGALGISIGGGGGGGKKSAVAPTKPAPMTLFPLGPAPQGPGVNTAVLGGVGGGVTGAGSSATGLAGAINAAIGANPVSQLPTIDLNAVKIPNMKINLAPSDNLSNLPTLTANQAWLPSNWQQVVLGALNTIQKARSNLNYDQLLKNATLTAASAIAPQLLPLQQQYRSGVNTIGTYTRGATEAANQLANQIGQNYQQAEGETARVSQQVQAMLGGQNPLVGEGVVDPAQAAHNAAQAAMTFGGGGNVLGGIAAMGVPALAQDAAAMKSYAQTLPGIYQTQAQQSVAALGAAQSAAEAKVLAGIPTLAAKIASGELSGTKDQISAAQSFVNGIMGTDKFNVTQANTTDRANLSNQLRAMGLDQTAGRLNLSAAQFTNTVANQARSAYLRAKSLGISEVRAQQSAQRAAVSNVITEYKAANPTSSTTNSALSKLGTTGVMKWWDAAVNGGNQTIRVNVKNPTTGQPTSVLRNQHTNGMSFNEAVTRFEAHFPGIPRNQVIALAEQYFPWIGIRGQGNPKQGIAGGDRPLDPAMQEVLQKAGALDTWQPDFNTYQNAAGKTVREPIAYLGPGQMRVLRNARMIQDTQDPTVFRVVSTGQTLKETRDPTTGEYKFVFMPGSPGGVPGAPTPTVNYPNPSGSYGTSTRSSGYVNPYAQGANIAGASVDQGLDVLQSQPYLAPGAGTIVKIDPNWYNGTPNIYEKLDQPVTINGRTYPGVYFGETSVYPGIQVGQRVVAGQPIAGGSRAGSGLGEQGFAAPVGNNGSWMQAAYGRWNENMRATTAAPGKAPIAAQDWLSFIRSLTGAV